MINVNRENTALLITDPQNDFLSPEGATWSMVGEGWHTQDGSINGATSITWRISGTVGSIARVRDPRTGWSPNACWPSGSGSGPGAARPAR